MLVSDDDAVVAAAAAEAVALASAAVEAARAAVWAAGEAGEEEGGGCRVVRVRRRGVEALGMVEKWDGEEVHEVSFGAARSAVLTPREEAEFCLCLKVLYPLCNMMEFLFLLASKNNSNLNC